MAFEKAKAIISALGVEQFKYSKTTPIQTTLDHVKSIKKVLNNYDIAESKLILDDDGDLQWI